MNPRVELKELASGCGQKHLRKATEGDHITMEMHELHPAKGSRKERYRKGRGHASGNGKTAGYGHKGQKARSGAPRIGFEGGQMPLYRRLPKRGFKNYNHKEIVILNVSQLDKYYEDGATVVPEDLIERKIIKDTKDGLKILGNGELTKKLTVKAHAFSETAKQKIEAAGGKAEVI